jgi:hypothetical protein
MPSNFIEADNVDQIVTLGNDYGELEKSEVTNPAGNSDVEVSPTSPVPFHSFEKQ